MNVSLTSSRRLSIAQAARLYGEFEDGKPTSPETVIRHIKKGCIGPDGSRVHLQGFKLGGRWVTTVDAVERFIAALTIIPAAQPQAHKPDAKHLTATAACEALGL
jgi:hypothetical protein